MEISSTLKAVCLIYLQTHKSDIIRTKKKPSDSLKQDFKEQDESNEVNNEVGKDESDIYMW